MISNNLKLISTILAIIGVLAYFYFQYQMWTDIPGGFKEGAEPYNGFRYARDNQLKSVDQYDDEKGDPHMKVNDEFLEGCRVFFTSKI